MSSPFINSMALQAAVLIYLREREGQWVALADLCRYVALPSHIVCQVLIPMAEAKEVDLHLAAGGRVDAVYLHPGQGRADHALRPNPHHPGLERPERPSCPPEASLRAAEEPTVPA